MKRTAKYTIVFLFHFFIYCSLIGQTYQDHFGTGNDVGVTVYSSDNQGTESGANLLTGTDLLPDFTGAARFLAQAGFGGSYEDIAYVSQIGIEAWIEEQMNMPYTTYLSTYQDIHGEIVNTMNAIFDTSYNGRVSRYIPFAFYQKALKEEDVLRQKAAFALNQIFVVSWRGSNLLYEGDGMANYYDLLYEGAFGNYRDLLYNVALNPIMGRYLSHFRNEKADSIAGTLPDENFAREIMQLFSIGLVELNNDGTIKLDICGEPIPTYDIYDVQEMAKVFTGLSLNQWDLFDFAYKEIEGDPVYFHSCYGCFDHALPMVVFEEYHDTSEKILPDSTIIPSGQTGIQDIDMAIDWLFNHPNVGPFISTRLIQHLVKSNPTPAYVNRVATVFNNNGNGVRGDLEAVFRAILIDPEARDCAWINDERGGKLLQPMERFLNLFTTFDIDAPSGNLWFFDNKVNIETFHRLEQTFIYAPSVFNYFTPFYAESEFVASANMVSPEFQILNAVTSIYYLNRVESALKSIPFNNHTSATPFSNIYSVAPNVNDKPVLDFSDEINICETVNISNLIDRLDLLLCRGQLHPDVKVFIEQNIADNMNDDVTYDCTNALKDAIYYIMASPSYAILK